MANAGTITIPVKIMAGVRDITVQSLPVEHEGRIMSAAQRHGLLRMLGEILGLIERNDTNYDVRYGLVLEAVTAAHCLGLQAGFRVDPECAEWPVAFVELPTGQVSWHMPQHKVDWDGHDTEQKYARIKTFRQHYISEGL